MNRIQNLRKDSGFQVSDRISVEIVADDKLKTALDAHKEYVSGETLTTALNTTGSNAGIDGFSHKADFDIDGHKCLIGISVV